MLFFDVRDASGLIQATVVPGQQPEAAAVAERLRQEYVVAVTGVIRRRQVPNPNMPTGEWRVNDDVPIFKLNHLRATLHNV